MKKNNLIVDNILTNNYIKNIGNDIDINSILFTLEKWRSKRRLEIEKQKKNLIGNILEELTEFSRANNEYEQIDAVCDMAIFILNTLSIKDFKKLKRKFDYCDFKIITDKNNTRNLLFVPLLIIENLIVEAFYNLVAMMINLGFNPDLCLKETINEISSRTGSWDDKIGKFVKDKGAYDFEIKELLKTMTIEYEDEAKISLSDGANVIELVKWYKADYNKCKLRF